MLIQITPIPTHQPGVWSNLNLTLILTPGLASLLQLHASNCNCITITITRNTRARANLYIYIYTTRHSTNYH